MLRNNRENGYFSIHLLKVYDYCTIGKGAAVPCTGPGAEQVEAGAATLRQWSTLLQQPGHHSEMVGLMVKLNV